MNYYGIDFPEPNDIVMVQYNYSNEYGMYVKLVEYNNIEGMITLSELHRRRVNPEKIFARDKIYPCIVIDVNRNRNTIDLSYRKIDVGEKAKYSLHFPFIKQFIKVLSDIHDEQICTFETLMDLSFRHVFNSRTLTDHVDTEAIFNNLLSDPKSVFVDDLDNAIVAKSCKMIESRVIITPVTIVNDFELTIYESDGIQKLKDILKTHDNNIQILCQASPLYKIISSDLNQNECEKRIDDLIAKLRDESRKIRSNFKVGSRQIKQKTYRFH